MKQFVLYALLKAFVISVGVDLVCMIYGVISGDPYRITLAGGVICFLVLFFVELIECLWKNRKKYQITILINCNLTGVANYEDAPRKY